MNATKTFLGTCALVCFLGFQVQGGGDKLVSQLPGKAGPVTKLAVGQDFVSQPGQKRKFALGDVTVLVNQGTAGKYPAKGEIFLSAGEIYVEAKNFLVKTGQRQIQILKGKVAVRADKQGTSVIVTHGEATVAGVKKAIQAGYQLPVGAIEPTPLPRASHALEWTKDLVSALPLVPASSYNGGALLARNPDGQDAKISLRKFHIDVHIEDGFARTTIDQTYFNQENVQLEGTFYFPLPPDASLSRLAMYVGGRLMEGGMAERDYARDVYESIRYANRDPALLEWVDGSTFKMRVFPLEPRTEKRIILSYAQRLPSVFGDATYRFAGGHSLQKVDQYSFQARIHGGAKLTWDSPSHELDQRKDGNDLVLSAAAKNAPTDRDLTLTLSEPRPSGSGPIAARFNSSNIDNSQYLMLRYRPDLQITNPQSKIKNPLWVFLFESSGDRDPLLGRVQIEVIRNLLGNLAEGDKFLVASAGTRVHFHAAAPQEVNPANIDGAVKFLEESHLIGALDLGNALGEVCKSVPHAEREAYFVHVGSGIAAMGERRDGELAQMLAKVRYVGIGVGHRWNRSFMKLAAEKTGGYFTQINPDEPIAWRVFDLWSTLATPRLMNIQVQGDVGQKFLVFDQTVAEGEEICAVGRFAPLAPVLGGEGPGVRGIAPAKTQTPHPNSSPLSTGERGFAAPESLIIRGLVDGKPVEYKVAVKDVAPQADYLPRMWAKLEIERLLAEDALKNKDAIVALSKAQYVVTPFTSLMVLEHEDLYTQYKVDRNRQDRWALYQTPDKIPVVYEPLPGEPDPKALLAGGKQKADYVAKTVVVRENRKILDRKGTNTEYSGGLTLSMPLGYRIPAASSDINVLSRAPDLDIPVRTGSFDFAVPPYGGYPGIVTGSSLNSQSVAERVLALQPNIQLAARDPSRVSQVIIVGNEISQDKVVRRTLGVPAILHYPGEPEANALSSLQGLTDGLRRRIDPNDVRSMVIRPPGASEDIHKATSEWHRFWAIDQPSHLTRDLVIRRVVGLYPGQILQYPELKLAEKSLNKLHIFAGVMPDSGYAGNDSLFFDLFAYAPGMNTSQADLDAVLEAEALPSKFSKTGRIDPAARALLAKARLDGWHTWTMPGEGKQAPISITFDGAGRYAYESSSSMGIKERVVCDGQTLVHLYPQLFVGAKRTVSRAHRADFAEMVPWYLPPAEDLAHGVDLKMAGPRTVALVPHFEARISELASLATGPGGTIADASGSEKKISWLRQHLVFGEDGKLAERQVVQMPEQKVLARQILDKDGTVRILGKDNKEVAIRKGKLTRAEQAPNLAPDIKNLVVLPLPYRTPEHVLQTLKAEKKNVQELRIAEALPLLAAYVGAGNAAKALEVFRTCFYAREQRQLGYYVLLASCGVNLDSENANVLAEHLDEPLAQYLALHSSPVLRKHASQWAVNTVNWKEDFLQHLSQTHALFQRWQNDNVTKGDPARVRADRQKALAYARANKDSAFGFAMLCLMQDKAKLDKDFYRELAEGWRLFEESPAVGYVARYEVARCLYKSGQHDLARTSFQELYERTLKDHTLPAIDEDFRWALVGKDGKPDAWSTLMREAAQRLVTQKRRPDVLILAAQCWRLGDEPLANKLLALSLDGLGDGKEKTDMTLEVISFLTETNQIPEAADKLRPLTGDAELTKKFSLWRMAANLAERRNSSDQALDFLEKALAVEYQNLPEVIDLKQVRADYGKLLEVYANLAESMVILKIKPAPDFVGKIIRAADRWRALDRDKSAPSEVAAKILQRLDQRELAWDYLTTPIALNPTAAEPWVNMAQELGRTGDLVLAERAYKAASEAEPTNAQILWDRAQNLRRAGKERDAQPLFRRIAEGTWQPRFQGLVNQARGELK